MLLGEFLKQYDVDHLIKLGSVDGSGFFYCGTTDDILAHLAAYDCLLYGREVHLIRRCIERINQMEAAGPRP